MKGTSKRSDHWDLQRLQRRCYYDRKVRGLSHKDRYLSIIMDAMDQGKTQLPLMTRKQKNDTVKLMKQKLMGVMAHGHGTYVYVAHPPMATGTNFSIECLWRTIMKLNDEYTAKGKHLPPVLTLQLDNASDNKSKTMLAFATYLVEAGVFESIELNFLMVGHTHEDIDQFFSVIAGRFKRLVFQSSAATVISYEDFQKEVMAAFRDVEKKPKCVDRVAVCHDFVTWFNGFRDPQIANISKFRQFTFRKQTDDEKQLYVDEGLEQWQEFDDRCVMWCKEYMSTRDSERQPSKEDRMEYGPCAYLRTGGVDGEPGRAGFRDLTVLEKDKNGKDKPMPQAYMGKTSAEILEVQKREWVAWVNNPEHGASDTQKEQFMALMDKTVGDVASIPADVVAREPRWRLPLHMGLRGAVPLPRNVALNHPVPAAPPPRLAYGDLTASRANQAQRAYRKDLSVHTELAESQRVLAEIKKGDILLTKNVVDGSHDVEWWLGIAESYVEEMERVHGDNTLLRVQWMHPRYANSSVEQGCVPVNDLNARFTPWFKPRVGVKGAKNIKVSESIDRLAVVLIGVHLIENKTISVKSKKAIAALKVGFTFDASMKTLSYEAPGGEAMEM